MMVYQSIVLPDLSPSLYLEIPFHQHSNPVLSSSQWMRQNFPATLLDKWGLLILVHWYVLFNSMFMLVSTRQKLTISNLIIVKGC